MVMMVVGVLVGCAGESTPTATPTIDPESDAGEGMVLFQQYCGVCHAIADEVVVVGPPLAHIATMAADITATRCRRANIVATYTIERGRAETGSSDK